MRINVFFSLLLCSFLWLVAGCRPVTPVPTAILPSATPLPSVTPTVESGLEGLTPDQAAALRSVEKISDYPLYTMHLSGAYPQGSSTGGEFLTADNLRSPIWGCALFAALGDPQNSLYGRNFDWQNSPALLLFTEPPDGYASVSMVDIAFLGFSIDQMNKMDELPLLQRQPLLNGVNLPIDGMNARGLAVGMAAVPAGDTTPDPQKQTIDSLAVIREMLDHAATVDEAVKILGKYNIDMNGGPPIHYLVADITGHASLIEFYQGRMIVIPNDVPWHLATNFLVASTNDKPAGQCWRYDALQKKLTESRGSLDIPQSLDLLDRVHQDSTQWSIVYHLSTGEVQVALGHDYGKVYRYNLK